MEEGRGMKVEGRWTREPATHQHNEILANKTILTLNLKQVARSRRHRRRSRRRSWRTSGRMPMPATGPTPKIPASNSKSHLLYLHSNGGVSTASALRPAHLSSTAACVCQIFILWIGSQDLLISMRAAGPSRTQVPLTNVRGPDWLAGWLAGWLVARMGHSSARK